jgi:GR25 family glycosyltransferase involved in LPS biosynthesis
MSNFSFGNTYASYVNLSHRKDRQEHMIKQLAKAGIKAERTCGMLPNEYLGDQAKVKKMYSVTPGAIGCHFSQVAIMEKALYRNQPAFVMEDDLIFCSDIKERFAIAEEFLNEREWDVFWLGATFHKEPTWHKRGHPSLPECNCQLNADWEATENGNIVKTYGAWSTYAYVVNVSSIRKILTLLDENIHKSIGIDWLFILLQPILKTYSFVPGCVKQMDNVSDIGKGVTKFSSFSELGDYWWQDKIQL